MLFINFNHTINGPCESNGQLQTKGTSHVIKGGPPKRLTCLALAFFLLPLMAFTQTKESLKSKPVSDGVVKVFLNARCACSATDTARIAAYPALYRNNFVNAIYDPGETIPFRVYFAEKQGGQLYFISKGVCRNISTSIKIPEPGYYFVRFFHEAKPALIEVDARKTTLYVRAFGKCELHETSTLKPKSN